MLPHRLLRLFRYRVSAAERVAAKVLKDGSAEAKERPIDSGA